MLVNLEFDLVAASKRSSMKRERWGRWGLVIQELNWSWWAGSGGQVSHL